MAGTASFWVQTFTRAGGQIVPGGRVAMSSAGEAVAFAGSVVPTVAGAWPYALTMSGGRVVTIAGLGAVGDVPDDFLDMLARELMPASDPPHG